MRAADDNGGIHHFLCLRCQFEHGICLAGNACDTHNIGDKVGKDVPEGVRLCLQIDYHHVLFVEIACEGLKTQGLCPKDQFQGVDAVVLLGYTAPAIGGINEKDLHALFLSGINTSYFQFVRRDENRLSIDYSVFSLLFQVTIIHLFPFSQGN